MKQDRRARVNNIASQTKNWKNAAVPENIRCIYFQMHVFHTHCLFPIKNHQLSFPDLKQTDKKQAQNSILLQMYESNQINVHEENHVLRKPEDNKTHHGLHE